ARANSFRLFIAASCSLSSDPTRRPGPRAGADCACQGGCQDRQAGQRSPPGPPEADGRPGRGVSPPAERPTFSPGLNQGGDNLLPVRAYTQHYTRGVMTTGHDLALALRAAYLALHRQTDATMAPFGVTADQFVLLAALAEGDALTQQALVRRVGSDASTVRAMLLLLEVRGLVSREPHPDDGRARSVALTPLGRQVSHQA